MCVACTQKRDDATCMDGKPVLLHVQGMPCPLGRHPNKRGIVRVDDTETAGVPYWTRLWFWWRYKVRPGELPGCGCVVVLKEADWGALTPLKWLLSKATTKFGGM